MTRGLAPLLLVLTACGTPAAAVGWEMPNGSTLELPLDEVRGQARERGRARFHLESGETVSMQAIEAELAPPAGPRDAARVADALVTRLELGEREGELRRTPCTVLRRQARCLDGWMRYQGVERARHGAVFEIGGQLVWLDVSGPRAQSTALRAASRRILQGLRVGEEA